MEEKKKKKRKAIPGEREAKQSKKKSRVGMPRLRAGILRRKKGFKLEKLNEIFVLNPALSHFFFSLTCLVFSFFHISIAPHPSNPIFSPPPKRTKFFSTSIKPPVTEQKKTTEECKQRMKERGVDKEKQRSEKKRRWRFGKAEIVHHPQKT